MPFLIHTGALIFLLSSLMFILKFSAWPLVNLFLGCLAFRGILAAEILCNTSEMQELFNSFLQNRLPVSLAVPLIFCGVGLIAHLYTFLVHLTRRQSDYVD
jgi:peptidoglycan/LPS O-acetylase OafA/YrhL